MNLTEPELKDLFKADKYAALSNIELLTAGPGRAAKGSRQAAMPPCAQAELLSLSGSRASSARCAAST